MGRSESATASAGYRVSIRDLIETIHDDDSCTYAYETLTDYYVFLEDENDNDNQQFLKITDTLERKASWELTKTYLMEQFDSLLDYALLIPVLHLVETTRWGYNREGRNGSGIPMSDRFLADLNQLIETCPPRHRVSWMIRQSGG